MRASSLTMVRRALTLTGTLFAVGLTPMEAQLGPIYTKTFLVDRVSPNVPFRAGGEAHTWYNEKGQATATLAYTLKGVTATTNYTRIVHALQGPEVNLQLNGGLRADPVFGIAIVPKATSSTGWGDKKAGSDTHGAPNSASVEIEIGPSQANSPLTLTKNGGGTVTINNYMSVLLEGNANAGLPTDMHSIHTADSAAAFSIGGQNQFVLLPGQTGPDVKAIGLGKVVDRGFESRPGKREVGIRDPYFLVVQDVTDPLNPIDVAGQVVMRQSLDYRDAQVEIDDSGIRLTVDRFNPNSYVSLVFDQPSSWVVDPYEYGATLTPDGLTAFGLTPQSGWQVTMMSGRIEAFFPFGPNGQPYDVADVVPPASVFTPGHTYQYELGAFDGAFVLAAVPEPHAVTLFVIGIVCIVGKRVARSYHRLRPLASDGRARDTLG